MEYYRIEVSLLDVKPAPWRQFLIKKTATFERLHVAIQDSCGWTNSHLYSFTETAKGPVIATIPDNDVAEQEPDAKKVKLSAILPDKGSKRLLYLYDFGDNWRHEVTALEVVSMPQRFVRRLLAGERAFPPEDCGGISGYENCVAVVLDKATGEIDDPGLRVWLGDWRPDRFDLDDAKKRFDR